MPVFLHYLAGPLIGALIGYITNYCAIRMLFRPLKPIYIGKFRLPFTPGIVPRRKDELARVLGRSIVDRFFNSKDLEKVFTSRELRDAFVECQMDILTRDETLRDLLAEVEASKTAGGARNKAEEEICVRILAAGLRYDVAGQLADRGREILREKAGSAIADRVFSEKMKEDLRERAEHWILTKGRDSVMPVLDQELHELGDRKTGDLTSALFEDRSDLEKLLGDIYTAFMGRHVRRIIRDIDIAGQVTDRVIEMSPLEVEELVLMVVRKELRAVIWLGAGMGALIGTVNIFL